jgi:hypothetical protein
MTDRSERAAAIVLRALTEEPTSTTELYDRVGYRDLMRAGLIDYRAFRQVLMRLEAGGLVLMDVAEDESTLWRLPSLPGDGEAA